MRVLRRAFVYSEKGFSLLELLIVAVLLGILIAVAAPTLVKLQTTTLSAANTEAINVKVAALFCLEHTSTFPVTSDELYTDTVKYLSSKPDAAYIFNPATGLITQATPSDDGITKDFVWDTAKQSWVKK